MLRAEGRVALTPTANEEPDFKHEIWEGTRAVIVERGKTVEGAVEILRSAWNAKHDKDMALWTEHLEREQEVKQVNREELEAAVVPAAEPPVELDPPNQFSLPTPGFLDIKPARHILKQLEKKEFMELWHFTTEEY